jgi:RNA polymerase sigma-70 factor (ECF subfamily)
MIETLQQTETELIEMAAKGSPNAFDEIVRRNYRMVYAHALRLLGNGDDAADATQVTFVKAHRSMREFDTSRPLKPWLYRICTNVCTDIVRGRHRSHESLDSHAHVLEGGERPEAAAERGEMQGIIQRAIARLPERYRRIIVLRHYEQMDVDEIAREVGAPEGTIKSWLFRARAILKQELSGAMDGDGFLPSAA